MTLILLKLVGQADVNLPEVFFCVTFSVSAILWSTVVCNWNTKRKFHKDILAILTNIPIKSFWKYTSFESPNIKLLESFGIVVKITENFFWYLAVWYQIYNPVLPESRWSQFFPCCPSLRHFSSRFLTLSCTTRSQVTLNQINHMIGNSQQE